MGVMRWIDRQIDADGIDDLRLAEYERSVPLLRVDRTDLARRFEQARQDRRARQQAQSADMLPPPEPLREFAGQLQVLAVARAVLSERQLREVMADFWFNHFNVFLGKGADRFLTPSYVEETIRPRALGKFEELLIATAKSPAMLFYLDNVQSVAPGSLPPQRRRGGPSPERMPKGLNENYARELLELHTLGVDGGYTQQDVIAVARILTGWSIEPPLRGGAFVFRDWAHDDGEKTVLGVRFPAGHGMDDGIRLLKLLANHHATIHHVSRGLCARFVADDPPDGCVDDAVAAWHRSGGDIREILRAIFHSADFWSPRNIDAKMKTPLEFVASAVRAVDGVPDSSPRLAQIVARLGQPLYQHVAPNGYPERQEDWVNSGALLARMNAAVALASGRLPGVTVALDTLVAAGVDRDSLVSAVNTRLFAGGLSDHTRRVIREQLADIVDAAQARAMTIGLALGGPEFQRQ
jgi:uncharacterized protein (DUF1800 family)